MTLSSLTIRNHITPERSSLMAKIGAKNTAPEMAVRSEAHRLGLRFRVNVKGLPGTPDLVFPRWKTVLFVHGCFWHRHGNCRRTTTPKSNVHFWAEKFAANVARDRSVKRQLRKLGWRVVVIWECQTVDRSRLSKRLVRLFPSSTP
jgi:DNA mismatch endonuclease (patch repair protein)